MSGLTLAAQQPLVLCERDTYMDHSAIVTIPTSFSVPLPLRTYYREFTIVSGGQLLAGSGFFGTPNRNPIDWLYIGEATVGSLTYRPGINNRYHTMYGAALQLQFSQCEPYSDPAGPYLGRQWRLFLTRCVSICSLPLADRHFPRD